MAPFQKNIFQSRDFDVKAPAIAFKDVWASPSNYAFTILLLLGGDVVARALAQLAGGRITPVAFSFGMSFLNDVVLYSKTPENYLLAHQMTGWVSYATTAINSAIGENKLMPGSDTACTVINVDNGQSRGNGSWVLGRAMRDFEFLDGFNCESEGQ